jgi:hypothetical protein
MTASKPAVLFLKKKNQKNFYSLALVSYQRPLTTLTTRPSFPAPPSLCASRAPWRAQSLLPSHP